MKCAPTVTALPLLRHPYPCLLLSPPSTNSLLSLSSPSPTLSPRPTITRTTYPSCHSNAPQNSSNFGSGPNDDDDDDGGGGGRKRKWRRRRRRRWSDGPSSEMNQEPGVLEELIDAAWIFKVLGSYGWMLPAIILSLLLATGPKAFLMALTIPIGQSALTLAFKKLTQGNPKRKSKTKKNPSIRFSGNAEFDEEEEEEEEESQGTRKGKVGYQTWVPRDNNSVNKDSQNPSSFGGWDYLDRTEQFDMGSLRRSARKGLREKSEFSRTERKTNTPLFLRLLIAVFPFLASWTKML